MGKAAFELVTNPGYVRWSPRREWDPVVHKGGLSGLPKKPIDFTNPYHAQNPHLHDPVIFGAPKDAFVFVAPLKSLQTFPPLRQTEASQKLTLALESVEQANARVSLLVGYARGLLSPPDMQI